ncbi:MAG: response regulator transcription factor [Bacteroidota bacterium]
MLTLQLADDHRVLTEGLDQLLRQEADFDCRPPVHTGAHLLACLERELPDVLLLDINLPDHNGLELCKRISKSYPTVRIIMLTMYKKASFLQRAMRNGAAGYLLKDAGIGEIRKAIRTVHAGQKYVSPAAAELLVASLSQQEDTGKFAPTLTRRERQVLSLIAREHTTTEIATELFISENTVESHRRNLLHKLNARNVAGLVRVAMEKGLLE